MTDHPTVWSVRTDRPLYPETPHITIKMCKAAAREFAAQMGEPLVEDAWTDEDTKDWTHILAAALHAERTA